MKIACSFLPNKSYCIVRYTLVDLLSECMKIPQVDGQGEEKRGEIKLLNAHVAAEIEAKGDRMVRKGDFLHYVDAEAAR